jgi:hypothetical protein
MIDHLDRIDNLGFNVNLNWKRSIEIVYDIDSSFEIRVFTCFYKPDLGPSFEDIIETSCDFFYSWYNKNIKLIKDYEHNSDIENYDKLVDTCLGDITNRVYRDFSINELLD